MNNINKILMNPARMRIIQLLGTNNSMTTSDICKKLNDIPRTTLYRHIKLLIDNNILTVISEHKIRGSLERTLALNIKEIEKYNSIENATQNAFSFLISKYIKFENYFNEPKADPFKDKIFLNNVIMMLTDEEFDEFLLELKALFDKYNFESRADRKLRDISVISTPEND